MSDGFMLAFAQAVAKGFEFAGIAVIVVGTLIAFAKAAAMVAHGMGSATEGDVVPAFRKTLGRSILTGLELLVAADIIRTVAVEPTLQSVLVLGIIVIIRTFLSFSLEVEIDGRWPWQKRRGDGDAPENSAE